MTPPPPWCCRRARHALAAAVAILSGCASPGASVRSELADTAAAPPLQSPPSEPSPLEAVLAGARTTLGRSNPELDGQRVPTDCSGYLRALYARAGLDLFSEGRVSDNGVRAIVRFVEHRGGLYRRGLPVAGDLVFFDNSYDRNGDGRLNDRFTHAGLVERVLPDGTALIVHATNHGIVREPMNLLHPHDLTDVDGHPINAFLRRKVAGEPPRAPRLMSELYAGFGRVIGRAPTASAQLQRRGHGPSGRAARRTAR